MLYVAFAMFVYAEAIKRNAATEKIRGNHIIIKQEKALLLIFFFGTAMLYRSNRTAPLVFLFFCGTLWYTGIYRYNPGLLWYNQGECWPGFSFL